MKREWRGVPRESVNCQARPPLAHWLLAKDFAEANPKFLP